MDWLQTIITVVAAMIACNGFWAFMQSIHDKKSLSRLMLLGLGHDRIQYLCLKYINRGWVTSDEYTNLHDYLYSPYIAMKKDGIIEKLMKEVKALPVKEVTYKEAGLLL